MKDWTKRFYSRIRLDASGCWIWTGGVNGGGYGQLGVNGRMELAHRLAYRLHRGVIKHEIDHLCRVRNCVNPAHLEDVTHTVNQQRGISGNSKKTHCPAGHPYSGDNLYVRPESGRIQGRDCKACRRVRSRESHQDNYTPVPRTPKAQCLHGHAFTDANTYHTPSGQRQCRACNKATVSAYRARQKALA